MCKKCMGAKGRLEEVLEPCKDLLAPPGGTFRPCGNIDPQKNNFWVGGSHMFKPIKQTYFQLQQNQLPTLGGRNWKRLMWNIQLSNSVLICLPPKRSSSAPPRKEWHPGAQHIAKDPFPPSTAPPPTSPSQGQHRYTVFKVWTIVNMI